MRLARKGRIILDLDENVEVIHFIVQEVDESNSEVNFTEAPKSLGEYFSKSFFDYMAAYTTSCSNLMVMRQMKN